MTPTLRQPRQRERRLRRGEGQWLSLSLSAIAALVWVYVRWLGVTNPTIVSLSFVLVVFVAAAQSTLRVAIATSIVAGTCFNFFFLPPVGTFTIADPQNWFALLTLLIVSVFVSRISTQSRTRALETAARRDELARLFDLTRDILLTTEAADPIAAVASHIARRFGFSRVTIFQQVEQRWVRHDAADPLRVDERELDKVMARAWTTLEFDAKARADAGAGRIQGPEGDTVWLEPLRPGTQTVGLLALQGATVEPGARDAIAGVTAIAIERLQLLDERKESELVRRNAELRSALLASLSHDLRTPLTAAAVAANNLAASWFTAEQRQNQTELIRTELGRLNRLFENLVDMARIETNAVAAERQWVQPDEIVETAVRQVGDTLAGHPVTIDGNPEGLLVHIDPRLTSTALVHLLENAGQYSPAGTPVDVHIRVESNELRFAVRDRGAGIPTSELDRVFDCFYRGAAARQRLGTGMGLAITRGLLAAEAGRVWAENHPATGAVFTIAVPVQVRAIGVVEREGA